MNVSLEKKSELEALLTMRLSKEDYQPKVEEQLKKFRKTARIPGFRPGTAPMGMVKKMVGQNILVEEVNRLASDTLSSYLSENKIDILGYPLSSTEHQAELDFNNEGSDFVLYFDLALSPEFDLALSKNDKLTSYKVKVGDKEIDAEVQEVLKRYSTRIPVDASESENDTLKVNLTELNEAGEALEGGVAEKTTTILPEMITDENSRKLFGGVKKGDVVKADIFKVFNDNQRMLSSVLGIPEEGLNDLEKTFSFEIIEINKIEPAEIGQELFDQLFGPNTISTEEEFREKIKESIEQRYQADAEHILSHELDNLVLEKHNFNLPDAMLKRWLLETKAENYTADNIEERYASERDALRYQLIRDKVVETQGIQISYEDVKQMNIIYTYQMFAQYGMSSYGHDMVERFAQRQEQDQEHMRRMHDLVVSRKVSEYFRSIITINEKEVNVDKFGEILEAHNKAHHNH